MEEKQKLLNNTEQYNAFFRASRNLAISTRIKVVEDEQKFKDGVFLDNVDVLLEKNS